MDADPRGLRHWLRRVAATALTAAVGFALCAGAADAGFFSNMSSRIFGSGAKTIALAPIIGAPPNITQELAQDLISAGAAYKLTLLPEGSRAPYTMRGYLAATTEKRGAKISYILDISDAKGQRVARISGDETMPKRAGSDPWTSVDSQALKGLASKIASEIASSMSGGRSAGSAPTSPAPTPAAPAPEAQSRAPAAAAAVPSGPVMALVSSVSGAPGDGATSLPAALKKRLNAGGVKLASSGSRNVYTVRGIVSLTDTSGGKQSIRIDWQVLDPNGRKLGTVSQQNTIPRGSLSGPWGPIADAAAGAAAEGIIKLLPRSRS